MAPYLQCLWALIFVGCSLVSPSDFAARMDQDGDGALLVVDCDDLDPDIGAPTPYFLDADEDGFGSKLGVASLSCEDPGEGYVTNDLDCDDSRDWVNPDGAEVCDDLDIDEDCSGAADDADPNVDSDTMSVWYIDGDGDGVGSDQFESLACDLATGWADNFSDCDDSDPEVNLGNCTWRSVSPGRWHTCGIDRNYGLHCWGWVQDFEGPDFQFMNFDKSHIRAEGEYDGVWASSYPVYAACGIERESGKINCWSDPGSGLENPPEGEFVLMDVGGSFACALSVDNSVQCWGNDAVDPPSMLGTVVDLQGGTSKFCARMDDGSQQCWSNEADGYALTASTYVHVEPAGELGSVCGLDVDGEIECVGDPDIALVASTPISSPYLRMSVGYSDALAVRSDGTIECWGGSLYKYCPRIDTDLLPGADEWLDLEMGDTHLVGLHLNGEIYYGGTCEWGECDTPVLASE